LSPAAIFFSICYGWVKYEESKLVPTQILLMAGFIVLVLYAYLVAGTILNVIVSIAIQLVIRWRHRRQANPAHSADYKIITLP
jgi:hypothetical protein